MSLHLTVLSQRLNLRGPDLKAVLHPRTRGQASGETYIGDVIVPAWTSYAGEARRMTFASSNMVTRSAPKIGRSVSSAMIPRLSAGSCSS